MTDKWLPKILKEAQIKGLVDVSRVWRRESTPAGPPSHSPDGRNGGLRSGEWRTTLSSVSGASPGVAVSNVTLLRFFRCRMRAFNGYHRDEEQEKKKANRRALQRQGNPSRSTRNIFRFVVGMCCFFKE